MIPFIYHSPPSSRIFLFVGQPNDIISPARGLAMGPVSNNSSGRCLNSTSQVKSKPDYALLSVFSELLLDDKALYFISQGDPIEKAHFLPLHPRSYPSLPNPTARGQRSEKECESTRSFLNPFKFFKCVENVHKDELYLMLQ